jgi:predicted small secreted protein
MTKRAATILAVMALLALAACSNTFEGMGRDMQHAGRSIENTF